MPNLFPTTYNSTVYACDRIALKKSRQRGSDGSDFTYTDLDVIVDNPMTSALHQILLEIIKVSSQLYYSTYCLKLTLIL